MKTDPPGIIASDRMVRVTATPSAFNVDISVLPLPGAPAPCRGPGSNPGNPGDAGASDADHAATARAWRL